MLEFAYLTRFKCRHLANKLGNTAFSAGEMCEFVVTRVLHTTYLIIYMFHSSVCIMHVLCVATIHIFFFFRVRVSSRLIDSVYIYCMLVTSKLRWTWILDKCHNLCPNLSRLPQLKGHSVPCDASRTFSGTTER